MTDDSSPDKRVSWRDLREFHAVDMEASFVLSWALEGESLQLEIDLALLAEHPLYEKPRPSQAHCLRAAVIEFPFVDGFTLNGVPTEDPGTGVVLAALSPGVLQTMTVHNEGNYVLTGEFGTVAFQSERPVMRLLSH